MTAKSPHNDAPDYWQRACRALARRDPVLGRIIRAHRGECLQGRGDAFETLLRAVVGQQISVKAAGSICDKLHARLGALAPDAVRRRRLDTLRRCGLSENKARCAKRIAEFFHAENISRDYWRARDFDEIRRRLLEIKGIGVWTFEMFAIFHLRHPDVLPLGDLGLVAAIRNHYNDGDPLDSARLEAITAPWRPWRTVATWHLWRSIDPEPVAY